MKTLCLALLLAQPLAALAADTAAASPGATTPPAAQLFFQRPQFAAATMAPDGRSVAAIVTPKGGRSGLVVYDLATMRGKTLAQYGNADVTRILWVDDSRLLVAVHVRGTEEFSPGLYAIDRDGTNFKELELTLSPPRAFAAEDLGSDQNIEDERNVRGTTARQSGKIVTLNSQYRGQKDGLAVLDTRSVFLNFLRIPSRATDFVLEGDTLRLATVKKNGTSVLHFLGPDKWEAKANFDENNLVPVAYVGGVTYALARNGGDRFSLFRYNLDAGRVQGEALLTSPEFDVEGSPIADAGKLAGFRMRADAPMTVWFDPALAALQKEIDEQLPATANDVSPPERPATPFVLVHATSPAEPGAWYVYDRANKKLAMLGSALPDLDGAALGPVELQRFAARDGLSLPVYTTLPRFSAPKNLPTVVLAKPSARERGGNWAYHAAAQFLASRGYAVIQPETRGTTGFGKTLAAAGANQWGRGMQDDLADAARWAVAQGIADPRRICIAGTAYGGYAATMALVRHPDIFRCAVNWSGMLTPGGAKPNDHEETLLGTAVRDEQVRAAISPQRNASRVLHPILFAYGAQDPGVAIKDARELFKEVSRVNPHAQFLAFDEQGQHWSLESNRTTFWTAVEAFLARHTQ